MAEPGRRPSYSWRDYLRLEEVSNVRHEYLAGEIYAMAGGTPEHAARSVNLSAALHAQLRGGPCRVFSSDLRVRVPATGLATYPDVTVVCGPLERDPEDANTVVNPVVVVEVLSERTAAYDRGDKLANYRQIPSLREVLLVAHDRALVEVWSRGAGEAWMLSSAGPGETVAVTSIGCRLPVDDVYRDALGTAAG